MSIYQHCAFNAGGVNDYLIGGNLCNAFVFGNIGSKDDFFLVGAEPAAESNYPLLTGNILDSEGNVLFRLVRNVLTINPGKCSRILGDHIGYEIHDSAGNVVFGVKTVFENNQWITVLKGKFFDKNKKVVIEANSGAPGERIIAGTKHGLGFGNGNFAQQIGMSHEEILLSQVVMSTGGAIHELITGTMLNAAVDLDGKVLMNAHLSDCQITLSSGAFQILSNTTLTRCGFTVTGEADRIKRLIAMVNASDQGPIHGPGIQ